MPEKNFRVTVCYGETFVIEIEANNSKEAKQIAYNRVDYWGKIPLIGNKRSHRDFFWVDAPIEEKADA